VKFKVTRNLEPSGDENLALRATWLLAPLEPVPNPITEGIRFAVFDASNNLLWQRIVPAGAATSRSQPGWALSTSGHLATYRDPERQQGDIAKVTVRSSAKVPGLFTVTVTGKAGNFRIAPGSDPVRLVVVLGNQTRALSGQCMEATFGPSGGVRPRCDFSSTGTSFVCR
jgi:hypothetical protein